MLDLIKINKSYKIDRHDFLVLKNINLSFENREFCAILGPSGCGKTTLLNLIGGLDQYDDGDLIIDGISTQTYKDKDWDNYRNKRIGFVFQSYNLIPHLSLLRNVEMALTLDGQPKRERTKKAKRALDVVGLGEMMYKKPNQLSGGQQQRVALARALINDPEIILADEPTGALDSVSSVQIMELLKEISKNRLVIMVTHNDKLANDYASRIIKMEDGRIVSDTNRLKELIKPARKEITHKPLEIINEKDKKAKKKRDKTSMGFFTALALSLRNLLTKKGRTILTSIAGSFGIIGVALVLATSNGFEQYIGRVESQTASTMPIHIPSYVVHKEKNETKMVQDKFPDTGLVYPVLNTYGKSEYRYNNFSAKYFNYLNKLRDEKNLMNDYIINYDDNYSLNLTTQFFDNSIKPVFNDTTVGISDLIKTYTGLPMNLFHILYGQEEYIRETYDLIDGRYPSAPNETVIVLDAYNRLPKNVLKNLGFFDSDASEEYMNEHPLSFDDLYDKKFKVFPNDDFYELKEEHTIVDNFGQEKKIASFRIPAYSSLFNNNTKGIELKITGVLRPNKFSTFTLMGSGLCYTTQLQDKMVELNDKAEITKRVIENFAFNKEENGKKYVFQDLIDEIIAKFQTSTTVNQLNAIFNKYFTFYNFTNGSSNNYSITNYLNDCRRLGIDLVSEEIKESGITQEAITSSLLRIGANINKPEKTQECLYELIKLMACVNSYSKVQSVIIFPRDLSTKDKLLGALDEFNNKNELDDEDPNHATRDSEKIFYMDFAGDLTKSLGEMINIISIVLVVFASISLCVSCVMTGIITYVSVIERTKEIGILRALGARKKDVGRLFEAESCIIGLNSGIFGCIMAYLICIPINLIINSIYPEYNIGNIANLNILHALILVAISVALTFFSGLIPARIAAKKNPVTALRTE